MGAGEMHAGSPERHEWRAWILALSGKGWWRPSETPQAHEAMPNKWFDELGLISASSRYKALQN